MSTHRTKSHEVSAVQFRYGVTTVEELASITKGDQVFIGLREGKPYAGVDGYLNAKEGEWFVFDSHISTTGRTRTDKEFHELYEVIP